MLSFEQIAIIENLAFFLYENRVLSDTRFSCYFDSEEFIDATLLFNKLKPGKFCFELSDQVYFLFEQYVNCDLPISHNYTLDQLKAHVLNSEKELRELIIDKTEVSKYIRLMLEIKQAVKNILFVVPLKLAQGWLDAVDGSLILHQIRSEIHRCSELDGAPYLCRYLEVQQKSHDIIIQEYFTSSVLLINRLARNFEVSEIYLLKSNYRDDAKDLKEYEPLLHRFGSHIREVISKEHRLYFCMNLYARMFVLLLQANLKDPKLIDIIRNLLDAKNILHEKSTIFNACPQIFKSGFSFIVSYILNSMRDTGYTLTTGQLSYQISCLNLLHLMATGSDLAKLLSLLLRKEKQYIDLLLQDHEKTLLKTYYDQIAENAVGRALEMVNANDKLRIRNHDQQLLHYAALALNEFVDHKLVFSG